MIDVILYLKNIKDVPEEFLLGEPCCKSGDSRLHYLRTNEKNLHKLSDYYEVLSQAPYVGKGTHKIVYDNIKSDAALKELYKSVRDITSYEVVDKESGNIDTKNIPFEFGYVAEADLSVPKSVSQRQLRLVLAKQGFLSDVERAIGNIPDEKQRQMAEIEWQFASEIERDNPWINAMYDQLGISQEDVDAIFIQASQI